MKYLLMQSIRLFTKLRLLKDETVKGRVWKPDVQTGVNWDEVQKMEEKRTKQAFAVIVMVNLINIFKNFILM